MSPDVWKMVLPSSHCDASFQTKPDAACQGRQARSPGSDVTATAHVKIFDAKIRSNLTWHSNMLKVKDLPEKHSRKSEIAAREERTQETTEKTSILSVEHGIVPIPGRWTLP